MRNCFKYAVKLQLQGLYCVKDLRYRLWTLYCANSYQQGDFGNSVIDCHVRRLGGGLFPRALAHILNACIVTCTVVVVVVVYVHTVVW